MDSTPLDMRDMVKTTGMNINMIFYYLCILMIIVIIIAITYTYLTQSKKNQNEREFYVNRHALFSVEKTLANVAGGGALLIALLAFGMKYFKKRS